MDYFVMTRERGNAMKLLVFSDSHTDIETMADAILHEQPQMVLHLGDHYGDALSLRDRFPYIPMHFVMGNTDFFGSGETEQVLKVEGRRLYMTHGHLFNVKNGLNTIYLKGRSVNADIVLFGHTHVPFNEEEQGFTLFNPGSCNLYGHGRAKPTYGCISISSAGYDCRILEARAYATYQGRQAEIRA